MIFAIGCGGGGGQPPVTKPTQGDQPHTAQPEASVATPVENTAPGCKDTQSQGLNEASGAVWSAIMKGNGVYENHPAFNEARKKEEQNLKAALEKVEQGALTEVPKETAKIELGSYIVDTEASDEGSSESPKGSHHSEEESKQAMNQLVTTAPQSSEQQQEIET